MKRFTWNSWGLSAFFFALSMSSLAFKEISLRPLVLAEKTIGVIRPDPVSTATEMSAFLNLEDFTIIFLSITF